jgi:Mg-chelatase subunit ChlD
MGQSAQAQSVVFVIDTSSSMLTNDAINYAKAKLLQSINGLEQKQQFQIVAYAIVPTAMRLRADRAESAPLYRATGANLTLARQWINTLVASGGTKHRPALQEAFRHKPDVIFFLTDADSDTLSPREISEIKTVWNKQAKTQIHCIKFGIGPDLQPVESNFLRTLAADSRGSYSYLDIDQLAGP